MKGLIKLMPIKSEHQIANALRKALPIGSLRPLINKMNICNPYVHLEGEYQNF